MDSELQRDVFAFFCCMLEDEDERVVNCAAEELCGLISNVQKSSSLSGMLSFVS